MIQTAPTIMVVEQPSFDQLDEFEWDALVERTGCDIRLTHAWCRTWWKHYGGSRRLRIFTASHGGRLAGALPMLVDRLRLGPAAMRVARIVGSDFTPGIYNPPIEQAVLEPLLVHASRSLLEEEHCDIICLGPLSTALAGFAPLRAAVGREPVGAVLAHDASVGVHMHLELPSTFDEYLASLSKQQRRSYRRNWRDLTADHVTREDVVASPDDRLVTAFDALVELHTQQWQARAGTPGHFGDWPGARAFHREVITHAARRERARIVNLFCDETLVGARYAYLLGDRWYAWLSARRVGPLWDAYGLGNLGLVRAIAAAIEAGTRWLDLGTGYYDHKTKLGARQHDVRSLVLARREGLSATRLRVFRQLARVLHLVYHKVWFRRVARLAPWTRGPLWQSWIRSRI